MNLYEALVAGLQLGPPSQVSTTELQMTHAQREAMRLADMTGQMLKEAMYPAHRMRRELQEGDAVDRDEWNMRLRGFPNRQVPEGEDLGFLQEIILDATRKNARIPRSKSFDWDKVATDRWDVPQRAVDAPHRPMMDWNAKKVNPRDYNERTDEYHIPDVKYKIVKQPR